MNKEDMKFAIAEQLVEIQELKQQLAEKDKEIEELEGYLEIEDQLYPYIKNIEQQIRHQVCEEIREWAEGKKEYCDENSYIGSLWAGATNSTLCALGVFLSEIEKGERK